MFGHPKTATKMSNKKKGPDTFSPSPFQQVLALLRSDDLRAVEQAIAAAVGSRIVEEYSITCTAYTQANMSVAGMTVAESEALLASHRDQLIKFGVGFLRHEGATDNSEDLQGQEQDSPETVGVHGLGVGFGIKVAIYYNFLAHRTPAEFRAYLKNRRIAHQARFARELRRVFDSVQQTRPRPSGAPDQAGT